MWRFSNQTAWNEFWNFNIAWQASHLKLLSKLFCDEIAKYPKEFSCFWMAVILVWGAQYVGEKLNDKVTRRWSNTVLNIIENEWTRLAFHLLEWVITRPALHTPLTRSQCSVRMPIVCYTPPCGSRSSCYKRRVTFCRQVKKEDSSLQFLTSARLLLRLLLRLFNPHVAIWFQNHRRLAKEGKYVPGQYSQTAESQWKNKINIINACKILFGVCSYEKIITHFNTVSEVV